MSFLIQKIHKVDLPAHFIHKAILFSTVEKIRIIIV